MDGKQWIAFAVPIFDPMQHQRRPQWSAGG